MIIPKAPRTTAPEKELRFTRSGQASAFWLLAIACFAIALVIWTAASGRITEPWRIHSVWAAIPLVGTWLAARTALRMTRHAYLILTPLGIEIFPFFRPAAGMRLIAWSEIAAADIDGDHRVLSLHYNDDCTAGVHLSLAPIKPALRPLLAKAIVQRLSQPDGPGND